jgi:hypothetical protein
MEDEKDEDKKERRRDGSKEGETMRPYIVERRIQIMKAMVKREAKVCKAG